MKYFQTSLGKLVENLSVDEKHAIQKLTVQFLTKIFTSIIIRSRNKVIEIVIGGKGSLLMKKTNRSIL